MSAVRLPGLDGRNLLGFLAAIGALRALGQRCREVALRWGDDHRPLLSWPEDCGSWDVDRTLEELLAGLNDLARHERFPWSNLTVKPLVFRDYANSAQQAASPNDRAWVDFIAGLSSDAAPLDSKGNITDTAVRTMSGTGHQHFLGFMKKLQAETSSEQLEKALFEKWCYEDRKLSLRWDPVDDRRYALRADDPSTGKHNEIPSVRGANRLAFEALACLPTYPTSRTLVTTGFPTAKQGRKGISNVFHWPLWKPPVTLDVLQGLLGHPAVVNKKGRTLRALGVYAVLSSRRFTTDRYRNFAPAELWPVPP
jgi:hypothetical protein